MKNMILATLALLSLGVGSAFAQGKPPGHDPGAAPQAFPNKPSDGDESEHGTGERGDRQEARPCEGVNCAPPTTGR